MSIVSCLWILNVRLLQRHSSHLQRGPLKCNLGADCTWTIVRSLGKVRGKHYEGWSFLQRAMLAACQQPVWRLKEKPGLERYLEVLEIWGRLRYRCLVWKLSSSNYPWWRPFLHSFDSELSELTAQASRRRLLPSLPTLRTRLRCCRWFQPGNRISWRILQRKQSNSVKGVRLSSFLWLAQKPTCDECISVEGLELVEFTAIDNPGNDLQFHSGSKRTVTIWMLVFFEWAALICFRTEWLQIPLLAFKLQDGERD